MWQEMLSSLYMSLSEKSILQWKSTLKICIDVNNGE